MRKKENITSYSADEIENLSGNTNWKQLKSLKDADIDLSDIPMIDASFWNDAKIALPEKKKAISLRVDKDVLSWFKETDGQYQTLINAVLRSYMENQQGDVRH